MGPRTDAVIPIVSMEQTNSCPLRRCTLAPFLATSATAPRIIARAPATMCICNNMADLRPPKLSVFTLLDYRDWPHFRLHSPRAERMTEKSAVTPSAMSVQTKKKAPLDLAMG